MRIFDDSTDSEGLRLPCPICGSNSVSVQKVDFHEHRSIKRHWRCICGTQFRTHEALSNVRPPTRLMETILRTSTMRAALAPGEYLYRADRHMGLIYQRPSDSARNGAWFAKSVNKKLRPILLGPTDDHGRAGLTFDEAMEHRKYVELARKTVERTKESRAIINALRAKGIDPAPLGYSDGWPDDEEDEDGEEA